MNKRVYLKVLIITFITTVKNLLFIIPYNGPERIALKHDSSGLKNAEFQISFDFKQLLTDESYYQLLSNGGRHLGADKMFVKDENSITFKTINDIPFGLQLFLNNEKL